MLSWQPPPVKYSRIERSTYSGGGDAGGEGGRGGGGAGAGLLLDIVSGAGLLLDGGRQLSAAQPISSGGSVVDMDRASDLPSQLVAASSAAASSAAALRNQSAAAAALRANSRRQAASAEAGKAAKALGQVTLAGGRRGGSTRPHGNSEDSAVVPAS